MSILGIVLLILFGGLIVFLIQKAPFLTPDWKSYASYAVLVLVVLIIMAAVFGGFGGLNKQIHIGT